MAGRTRARGPRNGVLVLRRLLRKPGLSLGPVAAGSPRQPIFGSSGTVQQFPRSKTRGFRYRCRVRRFRCAPRVRRFRCAPRIRRFRCAPCVRRLRCAPRIHGFRRAVRGLTAHRRRGLGRGILRRNDLPPLRGEGRASRSGCLRAHRARQIEFFVVLHRPACVHIDDSPDPVEPRAPETVAREVKDEREADDEGRQSHRGLDGVLLYCEHSGVAAVPHSDGRHAEGRQPRKSPPLGDVAAVARDENDDQPHARDVGHRLFARRREIRVHYR